MKREKTIPTLIGIALLSISLIFGLILTNGSPISFFSKASGDCLPNNIKITNVNHYSLAVSFTTNSPCLSNLNFNKKLIEDNVKNQSVIHYFEIANLSENTEYSYEIISGGKTYKNSIYKAKTAKKPASITPISRLAWGKVYYSDQKAATNSIVYLSIPQAAPISSLVTENGYWYISLATSFNKTLDNWFQPVDNIAENIEVLAPDLSKTIVAGNTSRNNPVPDIIIGKNSTNPMPTAKPVGGELDTVSQATTQKTFVILSPKESETITTRRPDIFGEAPIYSIIVLNIGEIKGSVQSRTDGTWHWSPSSDLSVGINQLRATLEGNTLTRNFLVSADSSSLAFTASSSATIIPTAIPTIIPTAIPTAIPTTIPTAIPTIIRTAKTSTGSGVPITGNTIPTIISLIIALGLIGTSIVFSKKD